MTDTSTQDPAAIEREIRDTQDNMSSTIDKIGDQLTIKNVFNSLLDKADESNVDARMLLDGARRNPVALGLIAVGAIWLVSEKDSKIPSLNLKSGDKVKTASWRSKSPNDYASHMSTVERLTDEDDVAYQRRRDQARSNFFMIERGHEEEESAFRQRLDAATETFRQKRHDIANRSGELLEMAQDKAFVVTDKTRDAFANSPLVGGILAAALGAAIGSVLPATRLEKEKLGKVSGQVRDTVASKSEEASFMFREKKDALLDKADEALKPNKDKTSNSETDSLTTGFDNQQSGQLV